MHQTLRLYHGWPEVQSMTQRLACPEDTEIQAKGNPVIIRTNISKDKSSTYLGGRLFDSCFTTLISFGEGILFLIERKKCSLTMLASLET